MCVSNWTILDNLGRCLVQALGNGALHIRQHSKSEKAMLCAFWDKFVKGVATNNMVSFAIKHVAVALDYKQDWGLGRS